MRYAIVGSRDYPNQEQVRTFVRTLSPGTTIVSGGAPGVDTWAEDEGKKCGFHIVVFHKVSGHSPYIRNGKIVQFADQVIAFHHNDSNGTANAIHLAKLKKRPLMVFGPQGVLYCTAGVIGGDSSSPLPS